MLFHILCACICNTVSCQKLMFKKNSVFTDKYMCWQFYIIDGILCSFTSVFLLELKIWEVVNVQTMKTTHICTRHEEGLVSYLKWAANLVSLP